MGTASRPVWTGERGRVGQTRPEPRACGLQRELRVQSERGGATQGGGRTAGI